MDKFVLNPMDLDSPILRDILGAPRRWIRILEIGKLYGALEKIYEILKLGKKTIKFLSNEIGQVTLNVINKTSVI